MNIKIAVHSFFEEFARILSMKEMVKVIQLVSICYIFNPIEIKSDERLGNRIATEKLIGKDFLENRTSSCSYH